MSLPAPYFVTAEAEDRDNCSVWDLNVCLPLHGGFFPNPSNYYIPLALRGANQILPQLAKRERRGLLTRSSTL